MHLHLHLHISKVHPMHPRHRPTPGLQSTVVLVAYYRCAGAQMRQAKAGPVGDARSTACPPPRYFAPPTATAAATSSTVGTGMGTSIAQVCPLGGRSPVRR